ncbi:hypothetical protein [Nonomuraea sp. B5E05]
MKPIAEPDLRACFVNCSRFESLTVDERIARAVANLDAFLAKVLDGSVS